MAFIFYCKIILYSINYTYHGVLTAQNIVTKQNRLSNFNRWMFITIPTIKSPRYHSNSGRATSWPNGDGATNVDVRNPSWFPWTDSRSWSNDVSCTMDCHKYLVRHCIWDGIIATSVINTTLSLMTIRIVTTSSWDLNSAHVHLPFLFQQKWDMKTSLSGQYAIVHL